MTWEDRLANDRSHLSDKFIDAFGPARLAGEPLSSFHEDIAASLRLAWKKSAFTFEPAASTDENRPALSRWWCRCHSVMNGKILLDTPFQKCLCGHRRRLRHGPWSLLLHPQCPAATAAVVCDGARIYWSEFPERADRQSGRSVRI